MTMQDMMRDPLANIVLMHADDKLMIGHMQSDWTGLAPILEEDIAASSMSQDDLSHALVLYEYLAKRFEVDTDTIAFDRNPGDYRCCDLVTVPDEFDWAVALTKRWLVATFTTLGIDRLATVDDVDLAARCRRLIPEQAIHIEHLTAWMVRLGCGTGESNTRMQSALDSLSTTAGMLFEPPDHSIPPTESFCCGRGELFQEWYASVMDTLAECGLSASVSLPPQSRVGGRRGAHAAHFVEQHRDMTEVRRAEPTPAW
ncbi:MAG: phenylacetate-CoA oxygenase subunit PaaC [Phycisphaerales bacterium]|jgi:ring-1,2-phenylacetyl-CoA epoxidase subunit PaaC|nr:phenylacetate-CoA oxygenase subunit PaaC [Phycisphaerales bacterium]